MKNLFSNLNTYLKKIKFVRFFAAILVVFLTLTITSKPALAKEPIGERIGEQLHQTSVKSKRPKTTGELKAEADGDVPLNERAKNITRDSAEAFGQFGQGITTSIKESARELGDNVTGKDPSNKR